MTRRSRLITAVVVALAFAAIGGIWAASTATITVVTLNEAGEVQLNSDGTARSESFRCPGVFSAADGVDAVDRCADIRRQRRAVLAIDLVVAVAVVAIATKALLRDPENEPEIDPNIDPKIDPEASGARGSGRP